MARPEGAADQPLLLIGKSGHEQRQRAQCRGIAGIGVDLFAGIDARLAWRRHPSKGLGGHVNFDRPLRSGRVPMKDVLSLFAPLRERLTAVVCPDDRTAVNGA